MMPRTPEERLSILETQMLHTLRAIDRIESVVSAQSVTFNLFANDANKVHATLEAQSTFTMEALKTLTQEAKEAKARGKRIEDKLDESNGHGWMNRTVVGGTAGTTGAGLIGAIWFLQRFLGG
jgi:uncharacterized membrane protein